MRASKLSIELKGMAASGSSANMDPKAKEAFRRISMAKLYRESHADFYKDPFEFPDSVYRWDDKKLTVNGEDQVRD